MCSRLKVRGAKNATKRVMIERIVENKENYANGAIALATSKTRQEPQCAYRLINVLFSDEIAEKFAQLGDVADRVVLDLAANDQHIWKRLNADYKGAVRRFSLLGTHDSNFYDSFVS